MKSGDVVWLDDKELVRILEYFPTGSTSFLFQHARVERVIASNVTSLTFIENHRTETVVGTGLPTRSEVFAVSVSRLRKARPGVARCR